MIDISMKKMFFDRPAVISAADKGTLRALSKFGAYVRRRARSSLRPRKRVSDPGQPPSIYRKEDPGLRTILFAYEPQKRSVVIGPLRFNAKSSAVNPAQGTVPELLEDGGDVLVDEAQLSGGKWVKVNSKRLKGNLQRPRRKRRSKVAARPFMGPAYRKELPAAAGYFQGQIH